MYLSSVAWLSIYLLLLWKQHRDCRNACRCEAEDGKKASNQMIKLYLSIAQHNTTQSYNTQHNATQRNATQRSNKQYSTSTTLVQHQHSIPLVSYSTSTAQAQHQINISTGPAQHKYNISTSTAQHQHNNPANEIRNHHARKTVMKWRYYNRYYSRQNILAFHSKLQCIRQEH